MPLHTPREREHTHGHAARTRPNGRARATARAPPTAPTLLTACRTSRIPSHPTVAQCAGWCAASATPTRKRVHHSSRRSRAQREECATAVPRRARHLPRARRCAGAVVGRGRGSRRRKSSDRSRLAGSRRATPNPTPPLPPPQPAPSTLWSRCPACNARWRAFHLACRILSKASHVASVSDSSRAHSRYALAVRKRFRVGRVSPVKSPASSDRLIRSRPTRPFSCAHARCGSPAGERETG